MIKTILIVEDEKSIQNIIKAFLEDAGYCVVLADDGIDGIEKFHKNKPDLVLLDIMLPKLDGFSVCGILRKEIYTPIILLTALDDDDNQIKGFDFLADDYITKPFSMPLVLKRIEAVLRRTDKTIEDNNIIQYKNILLNAENYDVSVDGKNISLTTREYETLKLFMENLGRVFPRDYLLNNIWSYDFLGDEKIINTHIKNIRKKLGVDCIETIRGVGYRIDKEY